MPARDPYALLGVSREASGDEIRKAYRGLVREHHPDANPDDPAAEERFKEIQQAYEVLSDASKRRGYDQRPRPPGASSGKPRAGRRTVRVDNLSDLLKKAGDLSSQRAGREKEPSRELRSEDLARFARLLGIPLDRILKVIGENATVKGKVTFGGRRPGASSAGRRKPPGGERPGRDDEKPPMPLRTGETDDTP